MSKKIVFSYSSFSSSAEIVCNGVLKDSKRSLAIVSADSEDILSVMMTNYSARLDVTPETEFSVRRKGMVADSKLLHLTG